MVAVLLTGSCIIIFTNIIVQSFLDITIDFIEINGNIEFIIFSYLIGMIFQEIGSLLHRRIINGNDRLLKKVFQGRIENTDEKKDKNLLEKIKVIIKKFRYNLSLTKEEENAIKKRS